MSRESCERVGKPWIEDFNSAVANLDMEEYRKKQRSNSMNGRGNPFSNLYNETVMPRTLSQSEISALFRSLPPDLGDYFKTIRPFAFPSCLYEHMVLKKIARLITEVCK